MRISKTVFKEYSRCSKVASLDDIYRKKLQSNASLFEDDREVDFLDLLKEMYDEQTGDDLIHPEDAGVNILLPYYNSLEMYAMKIAEKEFGNNIIYNLDTKKQKSFSFSEDGQEYICYLDGYQEKEDTINIFEVKATTDNKFFSVGCKIDGVKQSIFERFGSICYLRKNDGIMPKDKYAKCLEKLFDENSDVGKYIFDMAIERYYIMQSIKDKNEYNGKRFKFYLTVLNSSYTYDGSVNELNERIYEKDKDGNELVLFFDVTNIIEELEDKIKAKKDILLYNLNTLNAKDVNVGKMCQRKKKTECAFFNICWKKFKEDGSILEYIGNHNGFKTESGKQETIDLINDGYTKIDSIPREWLTRDINIIQRDCYDLGKEYINKERIIEGIKEIKYPIYHLDFESFPCPLPRFRGEHPYTQSVFQFSLHVEKERGKCDIEKNHLQFLALDQEDHREELIQKMIEYIDLSSGGTVLVYNDNFEKTRIKEFSVMFPKYKDALLKINEHVFDLMNLLKGNKKLYERLGFDMENGTIENYYNNNLHGSYSIKKVLPIFSNLTYKGMPVANGNDAIIAYASYDKLAEEDLKELQSNLIKYCRQDTWAMVVILWKLIERVSN